MSSDKDPRDLMTPEMRAWFDEHVTLQKSLQPPKPVEFARSDYVDPPDPNEWAPGRWWRVLSDDGKVWMETSSESEARREATRPGYRLEHWYEPVVVGGQWFPAEQVERGYWETTRRAWDQMIEEDKNA